MTMNASNKTPRRTRWTHWSPLVVTIALWLAGCGDDGLVTGPSESVDSAGQGDGAGVLTDATTDVPQLDAAPDLASPDTAPDSTPDVAPDVEPVDTAPADTGPACKPDHCLIGTECVANLTKHPTNPCLRCQVLVDPTQWSPDDGGTDGLGACDDGDSCSVDDRCSAGKCSGKGKVCNDNNPCTDDKCDLAGGCTATANQDPCNDGDVCTLGDTCGGGACLPGAGTKTCDDGNLCTDDGCDPKTGCTLANNATPCDDGEVCTTNDACKDGACAAGPALSCDDADVCTVDSCSPGVGCSHKSIANLCVDSNPCTDEGCDKVKGCVFPFNTVACDDGNFCTQTDTCSNGACLGAPVDPDDGNLCTDDTCVPATGPVHVPNTIGCDDGNACTLEDTCGLAACQPGKKPLACDDGNGCTSDSCDPKKGCVFTNNTNPCNDDDACTASDTCSGGACLGKAVNCDDGNACTADTCDKATGCKSTLIVSNACRPNIEIEYPPRAATIKQPGPKVTVKGKVKSGAGPITSFVLNGQAVTVAADGSFTYDVISKVGGNALVFDAQDSFGSKKRRVQSYLWSSAYFKPQKEVAESGYVDPGLAFWLSQIVIDDGVHTLPPNDLATIFELYLQALDISSLLPNPLGTFNAGIANVKVTSSKLTYAPAKVTLKAGANSTLILGATITNVAADLQADAGWLGKSNGKLTIDSIVIAATLQLSVDKATHKLVVKTTSSSATLNNVKIANFSGIFGFLINLLGPVIVNAIKPSLEGQINNALTGQIGPALSGALGALALNASFDINKLDGSGNKVTLNLQTDFADVQGDTPGLAFLERARVVTTKAIAYDNLGVPGRVGCNFGPQQLVVPKQKALELVITDDTFNELLYGTWLGGLFEFPVPPSLLGNVDLAQYGVSDLNLKVSAMLSPTMDDCNQANELLVQIGDFRVDAKLKLFGQPMDVVVYATFSAGINITATGDQIGIQLTDLKSSALQIDVLQDNLVSSEGVLEKLIGDTLLKNLVGQLGGNALGSFPIPSIDLSKALAALPPGTGIGIAPEVVTRVSGNSVVGGKLK